jgi:hypothetical protein
VVRNFNGSICNLFIGIEGSMMDNLPDDIRRYNNHPDSPFYIEPTYQCENCGEDYECFTADDDELCNECFKKEEINE